MFETDEKKQLFANWLWQVANADGNIAKEEVQILNNIGMSLGLKEIKYKKIENVSIDEVEKTFLLRELFRLSISDKDFADTENKVINDFIKEYNIKAEIVSATETWAKTYLENEKNYYDVIDKLLTE
ncbi:TerB family tellurite resistance protein [Treponema succinifaciens]|uniref:TerB family tellurite resistance protein n=1 Tax=Treponema succinifaciens TaxID=167 RepID=UPI0023EFCDF9|nr:TerB family tellurite resistance protein [Treponema succinifaciens]